MGGLIDLRSLPRADADRVLDQVISLDSRIFEFRSDEVRARFYASLRDLSVAEKYVVFYEAEGVPVGFNFIKMQPLEVEGRMIWAVGSIAGFLPGHTGGNRTFPDAILAMLRLKIGHPDRVFYFVSMLVNPGGYDLLVDLCPATYPSVLRPSSDGIEPALIAAAARASGAEVIRDDPGGLIVTVGRWGRDVFERRRETANIRFFETVNPGYPRGELLGICVPLDVGHLAGAALRLARRRLRKRLSAR